MHDVRIKDDSRIKSAKETKQKEKLGTSIIAEMGIKSLEEIKTQY